MAKIARKKLKQFGSGGNTSYFARFGSQRASDPVKTKDVEDIQSLTAWDNGLQDAVLESNKAPFLEDINALMYVLAYQSVYQLQEGIAEYDSGSTYYQNSIVKKTATTEIYTSLTDDNVNNALPSQADNTNWKYLGNLAQLKYAAAFPVGGIIMWSGTIANIPSGWTLCNGTNGTPDLRDRFIMGASDGQNPGGTGGANTHTHTANVHTHTGPLHNHGITVDACGSAGRHMSINGEGSYTSDWQHNHTASSANGGTGNTGAASDRGMDTISNVPAYYKLAFIMRL